MQNEINFSFIFFSYNLPAGNPYLRSLIFCFKDKFFANILFCNNFFSPLKTYEERKGSGAGAESVSLTNGSGSRRPKTMRILRTGSLTLPLTEWLRMKIVSAAGVGCLSRIRIFP